MHLLLPQARAVRAIAFNKSEEANWGVGWHQDRVITVANRTDMSGFANWSKKQGQWHCEPPLSVLDKMLFVRLHLDPSGPDAGPMEIALGSHRLGIVPSNEADARAANFPREICLGNRGDILIMHMMLLHRSMPAARPSSRRALRVDFSNAPLPPPLRWTA
ncbi:MAG: phytanoyl-CoA dioxygenase family protein [Hyphomicrobium sp.]